MKTRQAVRAMIPVIFTVNWGINLPAANFTRKTLIAGMKLKITLLIEPAFVFSVQFYILLVKLNFSLNHREVQSVLLTAPDPPV